jgi:hypothetical protein
VYCARFALLVINVFSLREFTAQQGIRFSGASSEVETTMRKVSRYKLVLHDFQNVTLTIDQLFRGAHQKVGFELALYFLSREMREGCLPPRRTLPSPIASMLRANKMHYYDVELAFYPTPRSLVPFVILLALAGSMNADVARDFKLSDYRISKGLVDYIALPASETLPPDNSGLEELGEDIDLFPYKGRAHKRQYVYLPLDNDIDHPAVIIEFVKAWTAGLREYLPAPIRDRLFVFASTNSSYGKTSFSGPDGESSAATWWDCLNRFRADHDLEHFTLENIRPTSLDVTWEVFHGDIRATATQANHADLSTTGRSYVTDAEKKRQYQRLGRIVELRTRWRESDGLMDPRNRSSELDANCATPGWSCIDPYDSPYTSKKKLCSAYGRCPACPLGNVNVNSALCFALSLNLLDAVNRAQTTMAPRSWEERYGRVKEKLEGKWLISFSPKAVTEAARLDIPPMAVPE